MGHYYSEMCCQKCGQMDCDCWKDKRKPLTEEELLKIRVRVYSGMAKENRRSNILPENLTTA